LAESGTDLIAKSLLLNLYWRILINEYSLTNIHRRSPSSEYPFTNLQDQWRWNVFFLRYWLGLAWLGLAWQYGT